MSKQLDARELLAHAGFVRAIACALLTPDRADDVVQETMLAAVQRPPRGRLKPWLAAVARRLALKDRRREARVGNREQRAARPEAVRATADTVVQLETQRRLVEAVLSLAEPYRTTVVDFYFHGKAAAEVAKDGDVSARTVETRLRRARTLLRARLDEREPRWRAILLPLAGGGALVSKTAKIIAVLTLLVAGTAGVIGWQATTRDAPTRRTAATRADAPRRAADSDITPESRETPPTGASDASEPPRVVKRFHPTPEVAADRIVGHVRVEPQGTDIPKDAYVELTGKTAAGVEVSRKVQIDKPPWFFFPGMEPGTYQLRVGAKGHATDKRVRVVLSPEREHAWRTYYAVTLKIAGRVRIVAPPGTLVTVKFKNKVVLEERSDRNGELIWLPGLSGQYVIEGGGVSRTLWHRAPQNTDIVLVPDSLRFGRIERFGGAWLTLTQGRQKTTARLDEDGAFSLTGLAPGTYDVTVQRPGRLGVIAGFELVETRGRLDLPLLPTRVFGKVTRPGGKPWRAHEAGIWASRKGWTSSATSGPDGRYEILGLQPGKYTLGARASYWGYQQPKRRIEVRAHEPLEVDFTIGRQVFGTLVVLLRDAAGRPIEDAQLMWKLDRGDGSAARQYLSPKVVGRGEYKLRFEAGKHTLVYQGQEKEFTIRPDTTERAEWKVKRRFLSLPPR